ncbi:hypothetical protein H0H81_001105 [Sphagnurus paluster]|uniref:AB hydrolase-1 domain-containing protein n=1 Tax=Sphagnurus paluster TaxID=117069 RepID=A0A9P7K4S4_9AGAR|nr:hypothetical protein H0H81_001105 [Sphagnurus paluster]
MLKSIAVRLSAAAFLLLPAYAHTEFNPRAYSKHVAACNATRRAPESETVELKLRYVDINPSATKTMLMVHGWPGLWSTWSNQIEEFKGDYRLIIPDLRGFGESTHPGDTRSSGNMGDIVGDLACILKNAGVRSVVCMGHDWGSQVCYEAARMRPDIVAAVIGAVVPYIPSAGPFVPIKALVPMLPKLTYQLFFDARLDDAVAELDQDIRRTVRATLRTVDSPPPDAYLQSSESFLDSWRDVEEISPIPFFTADQEDYFVEQYQIQGFKNTLQFYMTENRLASWKLAQRQANFTIPVPTLAIYPLNDPVADWMVAASMLKTSKFVPHLTTEVLFSHFCKLQAFANSVLSRCKTLEGAHWVHLENPIKFNSIVRTWLRKLFDDKKTRSADEL